MGGPPGPPGGWFAFGVDLVLLAEGGRRSRLDLSGSPSYRSSWGLPWMVGSEQTAAWVVCGSPVSFAPGDSGRVVIAPQIDLAVGQWQDVRVGDRLRAFEGPKVVGSGRVRWVHPITDPSPQGVELEALRRWVDAGAEPPGSVSQA